MTELGEAIDPRALPPPRSDEVQFVALGGVGEIGMNVALYGHAGKWLMVDLGITFGDDTTPGVEVILPDLSFIEAHRDRLVGLVITHAHEDHVGAVPYLWPKLRCPIYTTRFTANFLRRKLNEEGLAKEAPIHEIARNARFSLGPFDLQLVTLAHSIAEPNALAIRTAAGLVLHTADWKLDPDPIVGPPTDEAALRALGDEGVMAMMCDSTNALVEGSSTSEAALRGSLRQLIASRENRVAFGCFSSHIARLDTIARAAADNGRRVALAGRSLRRMDEVARESGYLRDIPPFLGEEMIGYLPRDEVVLICTGSQGEPRAALRRIANNEHPHITFERGDTVVFSSRTIPGNERAVERVQNLLIRQGVELVTNRDQLVHVSGHPCRDELKQMYDWVRPAIAVPVHGETKHLFAHTALARECGVREPLLIENGTVLRFQSGRAERVARVPTGRVTFDGRQLISLEGPALSARRRMLSDGAVLATVAVDDDGLLLADPQVTIKGLGDDKEMAALSKHLVGLIEDAVGSLPRGRRRDDEPVQEAVRVVLRRALRSRFGKRPTIDVHLVRL